MQQAVTGEGCAACELSQLMANSVCIHVSRLLAAAHVDQALPFQEVGKPLRRHLQKK
jgi:hypothetical protein